MSVLLNQRNDYKWICMLWLLCNLVLGIAFPGQASRQWQLYNYSVIDLTIIKCKSMGTKQLWHVHILQTIINYLLGDLTQWTLILSIMEKKSFILINLKD